MKAKVKLTYPVTAVVAAESTEPVYDWMACTTPAEAYEAARKSGHQLTQDYSEEYLGSLENEEANIIIDK